MAFSGDYFDSRTAQNHLTGGDGAKSYNWNARNTARAGSFNANTSNADKLTIALNANNVGTGVMDCAMAYQQIAGDFDCDITWTDNRARNNEGIGLFIASTVRWDSYIYIENVYAGVAPANKTLYARSNVNGGGDVLVGTDQANTTYKLRIVRKGDVFSIYRHNGLSWALHGTVTRTDLTGAAINLGIFALANNAVGAFVAQIDHFLYNSFATEETLHSDAFTGANGDPIDPAKWAVQSGAITIQTNKGQVAAGGNCIFVGTDTVTYEDGLYIEADFGSSQASDPDPYFQFGFQDEAYIGQDKNIIKVVYNNGNVQLYCVDSAGVTQASQTYAVIAKTLPKKLGFRFYKSTIVRAYADGVDLGVKTINIAALPDSLRPWVQLYNVGNTGTITIDNALVSRNTPCAWPKYNHNPLYTGDDQAWEGGSVQDGSVVKVGATYYRFYCAGVPVMKVGYMTCAAADFPNGPWTKNAGNPIIAPVLPLVVIAAPKVIQLQDGSWRMYVHCYDGANDRMYLYTTTALLFPIGWTLANGGNPVFTENAGQWDGAQIQSHAIIPPWISGDGNWHLYYGGQNLVTRPGGIWQMGHATSADGITPWTRDPANPILSPVAGDWWETYELVPLGYIKVGNLIHIVYQGYSGTYWRIGYATLTPPDFSTLVRSDDNPVITESITGNWDSSGPEGCDLHWDVDTPGQVHAFFLGSDVPNAMQGGNDYSAGLASTLFDVTGGGYYYQQMLGRRHAT